MLTTNEIAARLNARVLHSGDGTFVEIDRVYFSDKMSRLLAGADDRTLLVSHLTHAQLVKAAALVDAPAICLLNDIRPDESLIDAARQHHKFLMVSPWELDTTLSRLSGEGISIQNGEVE